MNEYLQRIGLGLVTTLLPVAGCLSGGCLNGTNAFPRQMSNVVEGMVEQVRDQGVLDKFLAKVRGHVVDPGIAVFTNVEFTSGIRWVGVDGDVTLDTHGTGTFLPTDVRQALIALLPNASDEVREAILTMLGWNRDQVSEED